MRCFQWISRDGYDIQNDEELDRSKSITISLKESGVYYTYGGKYYGGEPEHRYQALYNRSPKTDSMLHANGVKDSLS